MELISVIVPIYRVEQYLNRCVESIVGQTYRNLEIILVDDGSPDNCPAMCDAWVEKDSRIRVVHKKNGGLSDARNVGLEVAKGSLIGFVDSDDWIAPDMYQKLVQAMNSTHSDIAACSVKMVWEDGKERFLTKSIHCTLNREEAQLALLEESALKQPVWYKLYRKDVIGDIAFEVGKYHEDVFWSYQVIGNANKVCIIEDIGYYYLQRGDSIMGDTFSMKRLDAMEAYCNRQIYLQEKFPRLRSRGTCRLWLECLYYGQLSLLYMSKAEQRKVFANLNVIRKEYHLEWADYKHMKVTHQIWLTLEKISLKLACRIRNLFKVGF